MAVLSIRFQSDVLHRPVSVQAIMPEGSSPRGLLYMLHGYTDGCDSFIHKSALVRYCSPLPLAVIMPDAQCSFYMDTVSHEAFWTHVSKEVPEVLQKWLRIDLPRNRCFVGGISMGGYGALKLAMQRPDVFGEAYVFSPVTDIVKIASQGFDKTKDPNVPDYEDLHFDVIAGSRKLKGTTDDLFFLADRAEARDMPKINIFTGIEDFLYDDIVLFAKMLTDKGIDCQLTASKGQHLWTTWENFLPLMMNSIELCLKQDTAV